MSIESIKIGDILIEDSKFTLKGFMFDSVTRPKCHLSSFGSLGILYPVIVFKDGKGQIHLIDGKKRILHAMQSQTNLIRATVIPDNTPVTDIITLIFCNKRHEIEESIINKIQFICFAGSLNAPESWILQSLSIPFEFKPHSNFLRECDRINNLPADIKLFCHEKRFSLKQLINLTYHPSDLLLQIIKLKSLLQLTASTLDEIASNLNDYLKRENRKADDFFSEQEVQDILDSASSPREKTEHLRNLIHIRQYPLLSETNSRIEDQVRGLHLPKEIRLNWDRSLENKNLNMSVNVNDPDKWKDILEKLSSEDIRQAILSILDEL